MLIAFFLSGGIESFNKDIKDAGEKNTKIVFSETEFRPMNDFETYAYNHDWGYGVTVDECLYDSKYAEYTNVSGNTEKVLINCAHDLEFVSLKVKTDKYYYINTERPEADVNSDCLDGIKLTNASITDKTSDYNWFDLGVSYDVSTDPKPIEVFLEFYENKGEPVDSSITDMYMGCEPKKLTVWIKRDSKNNERLGIPIGEFFRDDDENVYYYDYIDTQSYSVGKELSEYVYK